MKRGEPFNVLRDRNSWSNVPRAEAVAFQILAVTGITATQTAIAVATTVASLALSVATSAIISALTPVPPTPKQSLLVNARDAAGPQEFVYGETRKGGTITYLETTRGGSVLYQVIALAAHEIESVEEIYINDEVAVLSNDAYSNSRRSGAGWVTNRNWSDDADEHEIRIFYHLGDQTAITDTFANSSVESLSNNDFFGTSDEASQNFGGVGQPTKASFVGNGIAYLFVRFGYASGVFQNGIPVITAKIRGKKVFDPRTSTTAYSNNAALCIRDFLTSSYGLNDPEVYDATITDDTSFSAAAHICDEDVTLADASTEKRYTVNGVVRADQSYGDVLQEMVKSCAGTLFWGAGKWKLQPGAYNAPSKTFTLDDLRSEISLQTRVNLRDQFNRVQGVFSDANQRYIAADYPPIESATFLAQDDDVEQTLDLDLPFTTSAATAQRLAKMTLFRGREQMVFSAEFGLNAFDVEVGEIVALTIDRYGWTAKEFEVVGWRFGANEEAGDLRVTLTLRETSEAAFDWSAEEQELIGNDSSLSVNPEPVSNLTASAYGVIAADGTFTNGISVAWDSSPSASNYLLEWTVNDSIDYAANGGIVEEADAVTTREQFIYKGYIEILYRQPDQDGFDFYNTGGGSGLNETTFRSQLLAAPERDTVKFAGIVVREPTTQHIVKPVLDGTVYHVRVRAFDAFDRRSEWRAVTFTTAEKDVTAPNAPTSLSATGGIQSVSLSWIAPTTNTDGTPFTDFREYIVYGGTSSSPTTEIGRTAGRSFTHAGLLDDTTYYYRVKAVDYSGNDSAYSAQDSATTDAEIVGGASVLVVYADSAAGANQSLTPGSRRYVQYVEYTGTAPSLPVSGTFVLFVGSNGQSVWPIYADDASGSGQSFSPTGKAYVTFYEALTQPFLPVSGQTFVKYEGEDGVSSIQIIIFRRSSSTPSTPSGGSYNFDTSTLSAPSGWSDTVPTGTDPIYASVGKATVLGGTGTDSSITWSTPRLFVQNGEDGQIGPTGPDGDRGAGRWHVAASPFSLPTNSTGAQNVWNYNVAFAPVVDDQAWFYTGTISNPTSQAVFICSSVSSPTSHTWTLQDEVVDGNLLVTGTVTTDKIDANAITADKIDTGAITTDKLDVGAVTAAKIDTAAITTDKLDAGAVTASKVSIGNGTLTADGSGNLVIGTVTSNELGSGSVTSVKIASNLESDNYVLNTSGWQIDRVNGDAEFNDVIVRGELVAGDITITGTFDGPEAITEGTATQIGFAESFFGAAGSGSFNNEVNVSMTFDAAVDVMLVWNVIFDVSASGAPEWGYRLRYGGTTASGGTEIESEINLPTYAVGAEEMHTGVAFVSLGAGTYTFRFDSWMTSGDGDLDTVRLAILGRMI